MPRLFDHPYAYLFQNPDQRIIFAIPYQDEFTLIGTTDLEYSGDPAQVAISADEVGYLCQMANRYFRTADHCGRCGLELFRGAAAARRQRAKRVGSDARLPARMRREKRPPS